LKRLFLILLLICTNSRAFWQNFFEEPVLIKPKPTYGATLFFAADGCSTQPGRKIKNNFEYTLSHQCVHALRHELSTLFPSLRIEVSHQSNEMLEPLQLANISNGVPSDLLVMIQFYYEPGKAQIHIWRCSYGQEFVSRRWDLSWCPIDQAYLINKTKTESWATQLYNGLNAQNYNSWFTVHSPHKVPLRPMLGIIAPALLIEIGIKDDAEWANFVQPLTDSLQPIIKTIMVNSTREEL
jgi:hypothetical protein